MPIKESAVTSSTWMVISIVPDVCKSPAAPVPYPIVGFLSNALFQSPNVRFNGFPVFTSDARVTTVFGDEAGVGGGVKSQVNKGFCRPITHNPTLNVNGSHVLNHQMAIFEMNCAGPEGPGNTIGMLVYTGFMGAASVGPGGTISKASVSADSCCATGGESSFMNSISSKFADVGGLIEMGKQAYDLATTDWSNPSAVLGAIGGVAGVSGFADAAKYANYAQQAYGLATTDWSSPGAALGAATNIGGQLLGPTLPQSQVPSDMPTCF